MYSSINNKGHFKISKLIFGDTGINSVIIDTNGEYGMTEHSICIIEKDINILTKIKYCLLSNSFQDLLKACSWSNYQIDWRLFTYLKKDFYNYLE